MPYQLLYESQLFTDMFLPYRVGIPGIFPIMRSFYFVYSYPITRTYEVNE